MNNRRFLIHRTYDVFVRIERNKVVETKLAERVKPHIMTKIVIEDNGVVTRWLHPDDKNFVYAGMIVAPLEWGSENQPEPTL